MSKRGAQGRSPREIGGPEAPGCCPPSLASAAAAAAAPEAEVAAAAAAAAVTYFRGPCGGSAEAGDLEERSCGVPQGTPLKASLCAVLMGLL